MKEEDFKSIKKFEYSELEYVAERQGSCYSVGKVYKYHHEDKLFLCIRKSGDCCYDFIEIVKEGVTQYSGVPTYQLFTYFKTSNKVMMYGGMKEAFPKMQALSTLDLVHVLYSGRVLIPYLVTLSDDNREKLLLKWDLLKQAQSIQIDE